MLAIGSLYQGISFRRWLSRALLLALTLLAVTATQAATLPSGFTETRIATGLASPTAMAFAPDGRLFVAEQTGRLRVIKNGALLATPFLTVSVSSSGERGLLGVAFDPQFNTNGFVYVYYTTSTSPIHNRISRFTASLTNPDVAQSGSEVQIFNLPSLSTATNHNGGAIHFGPDGKLYVAVGDNANSSNAPSLNSQLGKMLRINKDGTIPSDNPFYTQTTGNNRAIWARGLRNPFTFTFQLGSGRMHINDVGQNTWEEVSLGVRGANYGWPSVEGPNPAGQAGMTYPIYSYANEGSNCAIVGAAFYNPQTPNFPSTYTGRYFFGDYCGGYIKTLSPSNYNSASNFATGISSLVDIQVGADGALYYAARGGGSVFRVVYNANAAPTISEQPASQTVAAGQSVTFRVAASGVQPLSYQWQRNGANISGATSATYTIASASSADNGAMFRAVVTNQFGSATSNNATLTVLQNSPPSATITAPTSGTTYGGGQTFTYSGTASDPEDGTLPASAFTWRVDFHHDDHVHPHVAPITGVTSGSFTAAARGETEANVFYRVILTVRDSAGIATTRSVDVTPRTSVIAFTSNPAGLRLTLDGQTVTGSVTSVEGVMRSLGAPSPQTLNNVNYEFVSWSDNGSATHEITTPVNDTTYTATFRQAAASPVTVYQHCTFGGWAAAFGVGSFGTSDIVARGGTDNGVSSVRVASGYRVVLYQNDGFGGTSVTLTGDNSCLTGVNFNDVTSSLVVSLVNACTPTTITPYVQVNGGTWQQTAAVTVSSGSTVKFGPQPTSGGSWSWSGCGTSGTAREQTISPTASCSATATHTNSCGASSTQTFTVTVQGSPTPTPTATARPTPTPTATVRPTPTPTASPTPTPTVRPTPTATPTPTPTPTSSTYPAWQEGNTYTVGQRVTYSSRNYECIQTHTACVGCNWNPADTPSLWKSL